MRSCKPQCSVNVEGTNFRQREQASRGEESRPADRPSKHHQQQPRRRPRRRNRAGARRGGKKGEAEGRREGRRGAGQRRDRGDGAGRAERGTQERGRETRRAAQSGTTSKGRGKKGRDKRTSWSRPRHSRAWLCANRQGQQSRSAGAVMRSAAPSCQVGSRQQVRRRCPALRYQIASTQRIRGGCTRKPLDPSTAGSVAS